MSNSLSGSSSSSYDKTLGGHFGFGVGASVGVRMDGVGAEVNGGYNAGINAGGKWGKDNVHSNDKVSTNDNVLKSL